MPIPRPTFWTSLISAFNHCMRDGGGEVTLLSQDEESCRVQISADVEEPDDDFEGSIAYLGTFAGVDLVRAGGFVVEASGPVLYAIAMSGDADWSE